MCLALHSENNNSRSDYIIVPVWILGAVLVLAVEVRKISYVLTVRGGGGLELRQRRCEAEEVVGSLST